MGTLADGVERNPIDLGMFVLSEHDLMTTTARVTELVRDRVGADLAGVTVLADGVPAAPMACPDPRTTAIDQVQFDTDDGPCLQAARSGGWFRIDDTATDRRWPEFAAVAQANGVLSTLSLPIAVDDRGLGAFNLYAVETDRFARQPTDDTTRYVARAAVLLLNARELWDARTQVDHLDTAMRSRSTIDQAIGILMAPGGMTPAEAFQLLVRASQRESRKLRDIAGDIVQRTIHRHRPTN